MKLNFENYLKFITLHHKKEIDTDYINKLSKDDVDKIVSSLSSSFNCNMLKTQAASDYTKQYVDHLKGNKLNDIDRFILATKLFVEIIPSQILDKIDIFLQDKLSCKNNDEATSILMDKILGLRGSHPIHLLDNSRWVDLDV